MADQTSANSVAPASSAPATVQSSRTASSGSRAYQKREIKPGFNIPEPNAIRGQNCIIEINEQMGELLCRILDEIDLDPGESPIYALKKQIEAYFFEVNQRRYLARQRYEREQTSQPSNKTPAQIPDAMPSTNEGK